MCMQLVCCENRNIQAIQPRSLDAASPGRDTFELAQVIMRFVQKIVLYSPNNPDRSPELRAIATAEERRRRIYEIDEILGAINDQARSGIREEEYTYELWFRRIVPLVTRRHVGNCSEMAAVGLQYAIDHLVDHRVEIFNILGGDHAFLVIGRDPHSRLHEYQNWGAKAVVCDPWSSSCFYAEEIEAKLINAVRIAPYVTITKPFNPASHKLDMWSPKLTYDPTDRTSESFDFLDSYL
jgi:hypothetical protein